MLWATFLSQKVYIYIYLQPNAVEKLRKITTAWVLPTTDGRATAHSENVNVSSHLLKSITFYTHLHLRLVQFKLHKSYGTRAQQLLKWATVWPQQTWAEKWAGAAVGGTGSWSNTTWPGPRPTSLPSGILIHPTVWPQLWECHVPPHRNTLTDYFYP